MATKFYAVRHGKKKGIFVSWEECKNSVNHYPNAEYKSFSSLLEAKKWIKSNAKVNSGKENDVLVYVDGGYDEMKGICGCGWAIIINKMVSHQGYFAIKDVYGSRNVTGEINAVLAAIKYCTKLKLNSFTICHDYYGISKWINKEWKANTPIAKFYTSEFNKIIKVSKLKVDFKKVKGHSDDKFNNLVDSLATKAMQGK